MVRWDITATDNMNKTAHPYKPVSLCKNKFHSIQEERHIHHPSQRSTEGFDLGVERFGISIGMPFNKIIQDLIQS